MLCLSAFSRCRTHKGTERCPVMEEWGTLTRGGSVMAGSEL